MIVLIILLAHWSHLYESLEKMRLEKITEYVTEPRKHGWVNERKKMS